MPEIVVTTRDGQKHNISFTPGTTLMQALTEGGIDELLALCGGVCSCATCHVHLAADFNSCFEPISADEDALLDGSEHRDAHSRLSCQCRLNSACEGLQLTIAQED